MLFLAFSNLDIELFLTHVQHDQHPHYLYLQLVGRKITNSKKGIAFRYISATGLIDT